MIALQESSTANCRSCTTVLKSWSHMLFSTPLRQALASFSHLLASLSFLLLPLPLLPLLSAEVYSSSILFSYLLVPESMNLWSVILFPYYHEHIYITSVSKIHSGQRTEDTQTLYIFKELFALRM